MSLFDIRKKLYKKDPPLNISEHPISEYDPSASKISTGAYSEEDLWLEKKAGLQVSEKRVIGKGLIILGSILAIILAAVIIFEFRLVAFNKRNAQVVIAGPEQIKSGQLVRYEITYKNNNWVNMKNATVKIHYPENFRPEPDKNFKIDTPTSGIYSLGIVMPRSSGKIVFSGKAYSPKGALIYLKTDFSYQPFTFAGQFEANAQLGVSVIPAPITLEIHGQQDVVSGNAIDYAVTYKNDGSETMEGLQVKVAYPEGFTFVSSSPAATKDNNIWQLGALGPGESGRISINGRLEGVNGMTRTAGVSVGVMDGGEFMSYNDEAMDTKMAASPLLIAQTVNDQKQLNANAGEYLQFKIAYQNSGNIGLRDVIVTEKLDSPVLDYSTLDIKGGKFDASTKLITWKASDIEAFKTLNPGVGGLINFSIHVKNNIPLDGKDKKNFVIVSLAKIDSPDVPTPIATNKIISSNEMDMKLNSKMILETKGFYNDSTISNSGPIPPIVGQETTYTMHWKVRNVSNDISDAKVSAILPTNATMTGKFFPDDARINYNERTNSIVWDIGKIDAGTGVLNDPLEAAFQIKIKPSVDQFNKEVGLLGISTFSAKDLFTRDDLSVASATKSSSLPEDVPLTKAGGGRVSN
ncbi:MAG: hypothetical protein WC022_03590 [Parcubacteria group bacterium]